MSSKKSDPEFFILRYPCTLASLRRYNKHTQSDLAKLLGVSKNSVSAWETNQSFMRVDHLFDICNEYDVDPSAVYSFGSVPSVHSSFVDCLSKGDVDSPDDDFEFENQCYFPFLDPLFGPDDPADDDLPY